MAAPSIEPTLSVVVPTLNEADGLVDTLQPLQPWRARGTEVIVVDGGSTDGTPERARPWADRVLTAPRGRARQMNPGAEAAEGGILLFLHADTRLPPDGDAAIREALSGRSWGRFDIRLSGAEQRPLLRWVGSLMNHRSRLSGIATGDQAIFAIREAFLAAGGFPDIPLMEDVALSRRLKRIAGRPARLRERAITSSRRWEARGIARTIGLMWALRLAYTLGVPPHVLARLYR